MLTGDFSNKITGSKTSPHAILPFKISVKQVFRSTDSYETSFHHNVPSSLFENFNCHIPLKGNQMFSLLRIII